MLWGGEGGKVPWEHTGPMTQTGELGNQGMPLWARDFYVESKQTGKFLHIESSIYKGPEESYCLAHAPACYTQNTLSQKFTAETKVWGLKNL